MVRSPLEPYLEEAFRIDPERGMPVVEIAVARHQDLFNPLDRAPLRRRDLSADLKRFLEDCSYWIPLPQPFTLEVRILEEPPDPERERDVVAGVRNYFAHLIHVTYVEARWRRRRIAAFVLLSFLVLSIALWAGNALDRNRVLGSFLITGFTVGGWVFLWEAVSMAFIRSFDVSAVLARHDRLARCEIRFVHGP